MSFHTYIYKVSYSGYRFSLKGCDRGHKRTRSAEKNIFIKSLAQKITNLTEEAKRIAYEVKEKLKELALF